MKREELIKQSNIDWKLYHHAVISNLLPHQVPNPDLLRYIKHWYFARWTSNFDNTEKTNWWYLIKDGKYNKDVLPRKTRRELRKANENLYSKPISFEEYEDELFSVYLSAVLEYKNSDNSKDREKVLNEYKKLSNENYLFIGTFLKASNEMVAFAILKEDVDKNKKVATWSITKHNPEYLESGSSLSLCDFVLAHFLNERGCDYIVNSERTIRHKTNRQQYLIEKFNYRKVYCNLHLQIKWWLKVILVLLRPFKGLMKKNNKNAFINNVVSLYYLIDIYRGKENEQK